MKPTRRADEGKIRRAFSIELDERQAPEPRDSQESVAGFRRFLTAATRFAEKKERPREL